VVLVVSEEVIEAAVVVSVAEEAVIEASEEAVVSVEATEALVAVEDLEAVVEVVSVTMLLNLPIKEILLPSKEIVKNSETLSQTHKNKSN
jgi:hypothetical protein